jgi:hypothetical protein
VVTAISRLMLVRTDRVRVARRRFARAPLAVVLAIAGCAATTVTLRSNHFRLAVPPGWQVVEAGGGGEIPTLIRAPAKDGSPEVELRLYSWLVPGPPADASGDVLQRLAAMNVLGLAAARSDDDDPCPDRAAQFFVFGAPARAIHLTNSDGRRVVVTAGESGGSLVGVTAAVAAGGSGCAGVEAMDAAVERLAATMTGADLSGPALPPTAVPHADPTVVPP